MKILQVNKFNYLRGGAEKYFLEITSALEKAGHELAVFSMEHPKNLPSPCSGYFVSRLSFNEGEFKDKLKAPGRIIYSREARQKFKRLLDDFQPDIIHIHNIYHQISPSILFEARARKIPVVMHLHDYKLFCPNYKLYTQNKICYRCQNKKYSQAITHKCFRDSVMLSSLVALEMNVHHKLWKIYENSVSAFIAPSQFMAETAKHFGYPRNKIFQLYNFIDKIDKTPATLGNYILYFGRLSAEKGIDVLLRALAKCPGEILKIVGSGPELSKLEKLVIDLHINNRVEFCGQKSGQELHNIIKNAKIIAVPSVWLENMPFSLLEAMSMAKPIIASRVGGLPEMIDEGRSGFLFTAGSVEELSAVISNLPKFNLAVMGETARERVRDLGIDKHLESLESIYRRVL